MKRKILSAVMLLLFFSVPLCFGEETAQGIPVAVAPESLYKFTSAMEGDEVLHDFVLQNKGTADLKITRVQTG